jgi:hypothetical protein
LQCIQQNTQIFHWKVGSCQIEFSAKGIVNATPMSLQLMLYLHAFSARTSNMLLKLNILKKMFLFCIIRRHAEQCYSSTERSFGKLFPSLFLRLEKLVGYTNASHRRAAAQ